MAYKKTVKKYNNKKQNNKSSKTNKTSNTKSLLKNDKNNYSTGNKIKEETKHVIPPKQVVANSSKPENKSVAPPHKNSNLKEKQDQDILSYKKDKRKSIIYCIIAGLITMVAVVLIGQNVFNKNFTANSPDLLLLGRVWGIILFFVFYLCSMLAIGLIAFSNKTDNTAYMTDIILYTVLLMMCFTISLLLYPLDLFMASSIISILATALSIYMTYRYFVSYTWSGILQSISSLILLYCCYVTLAFTL